MESLITIFNISADEAAERMNTSSPARRAERMRETTNSFIDWAAAALPARAWLQRRVSAPARPHWRVPDAKPCLCSPQPLQPYCLANRAWLTPKAALETDAVATPLRLRFAPPW